jgi:Flp pilus assembly protein TadD
MIGRVSLMQNDVARAIKALEHSVELGARPEAVSQLAMAYRRAGNVEQAELPSGQKR